MFDEAVDGGIIPAFKDKPPLNPEMFEVNLGETKRLRAIVVNQLAVDKRGVLPIGLLGNDEAVVNFTGTTEQWARFINNSQVSPVIDGLADDNEKKLGIEKADIVKGEKLYVRSTGIHLVLEDPTDPEPRGGRFMQKTELDGKRVRRVEVVGADMSEDGLRLAVLPAAVDTYIGLKPFSLFPGDDDVLLTGLVQARNRGFIIIQYPPDYKSRSFTRDETKVLIRTQAIRPKAVQQLRPEDVEIIDIKMGQVPLEFKRMIVPQKATARLS